jgi:hypothetical protein
MGKLRLKLNELEVESWTATPDGADGRGTVLGRLPPGGGGPTGPSIDACIGPTFCCNPTANTTCCPPQTWYGTCDQSECYGTCYVTCPISCPVEACIL